MKVKINKRIKHIHVYVEPDEITHYNRPMLKIKLQTDTGENFCVMEPILDDDFESRFETIMKMITTKMKRYVCET